MPRTVLVELLSPSKAKQQAFVRIQEEVSRLGETWAAATSSITRSAEAFAPVTLKAANFALRSLAMARRSCEPLPDPWRATFRAFLRNQAAEVRGIRRSVGEGGHKAFSPLQSGFASDRERQRATTKAASPVLFSANAWSLTVGDDKWKLVIPVMGRTVALPIHVSDGQAAVLRRMMVEGIPLEGRLFNRRGRWFFAARYLNDAPRPHPDAPSIGVDFGQSMRAVAFNPQSGRRLYLSGRRDRALEGRYNRRIKGLRQAGASRPARHLQAKLERFRLHRDRELAIALVRFANVLPVPLAAGDVGGQTRVIRPTLKFEAHWLASRQGLQTDSPDGFNSRFSRIIRMVARRAEPVGIAVLAVDASLSSQRCASCGSVERAQRQGTRFSCQCGYSALADLNAARNLAQTASWSQTLQFAAAKQSLGGQADGTAVFPTRNRYKGGASHGESSWATKAGASPLFGRNGHAASKEHQTLAAFSCKEESTMASIVKDLNDSTSKFVVGTLDNVKSYLDKTSEELSKVDVVNVTRHIFDTALDGAKNVVKTASEPSTLDAFGRLKAVADGTLEATREVVNVLAEEGKKADVFGMSTRIALEGLNVLRTEVDLGLDTTKTLFNRLAPLASSAKPVITRTPQVTRIEIEHDKPAKSSKTSGSAS